MVNSLRVWGREPPRSGSRRLGFMINLYWDLGGRLVAGPTRGPCRLQDPSVGHLPHGLLMRSGFMAVDSFGPSACSLYATRAFSEVRPLWHRRRHTGANVGHIKGSRAERSRSPPVTTHVSDGESVT